MKGIIVKEQILLQGNNMYERLEQILAEHNADKILLVCDSSIKFLKLDSYFEILETKLGTEVIRFQDFIPNPTYESIVEGVKILNQNNCKIIIAVGGGSAIDVAKCIKLFCNMSSERCYLDQPIISNDICLIAVPTTAGTGSEATRYAVIYYNGKKQSVSDFSCIPDCVLFDPTLLDTLPVYQKKATMMDAFCHAIEAYWSVNSTDESKALSRQAISIILDAMDGYIANTQVGNEKMQKAAYYAGKAINITQTTAGHAMSYKLTSLYGISHGHAVAICLPPIWDYMLAHTTDCIDPRGEEYLQQTFDELATILGCQTGKEAVVYFERMLEKLELKAPGLSSTHDLDILARSVNPDRLKNNPIRLCSETLYQLYEDILKGKGNINES